MTIPQLLIEFPKYQFVNFCLKPLRIANNYHVYQSIMPRTNQKVYALWQRILALMAVLTIWLPLTVLGVCLLYSSKEQSAVYQEYHKTGNKLFSRPFAFYHLALKLEQLPDKQKTV